MDQTINSLIKPQETTKQLLNKLPSRRMRDVVIKRFGIGPRRRKTLEAVGQDYKITRERVRQIEESALRHLSKDDNVAGVKSATGALEAYLKDRGGVMAEHQLFATLVDKRHYPDLSLLLRISKPFQAFPETAAYHTRWALSKDAASKAEQAMDAVVDHLVGRNCPVSEKELYDVTHRKIEDIYGEKVGEDVTASYLGTSKTIRKNPYDEYGLVSWSSINPRGTKDRAYAVLSKAKHPLHFREVADAISKTGWTKKKAHAQTVHNELIKDSRFVLVGRGLYALRDWGYEPGVVRDVLVSVLKSAGRPLSKEEVVKLIQDKRLVKPQTILLNLQNKTLFRRTDEGKYFLV